jgi:hypothetical protein
MAISKKKRLEVYNKYDGHCAYCGKEIEYKEMQVDHLEPKHIEHLLKMDGKNVDDIDNLMPSCRRCNHYKRGLSLNHFKYMIASLPERISKNYIVKVALDFGIMSFDEWDGLFYFEKLTNKY